MSVSEYKRSYNSFGGCDIQATFGGRLIGEVQGISYSVTRERAPIYTMGSANPRSFSRGKRGIAGTLVFTVFDRAALLDSFKNRPGKEGWYFANKAELHPGQQVQELDLAATAGTIVADHAWAPPAYVDQIPPFDVVLTAANEYGQAAQMQIRGVEIMNEGMGVSIDDIVTETQMTFVAREIIPWVPTAEADANGSLIRSYST